MPMNHMITSKRRPNGKHRPKRFENGHANIYLILLPIRLSVENFLLLSTLNKYAS